MRSLIIAILAVACVPATLGYAQGATSERPNVVLIITDDLGWADVGAYGSPDVRTPHIDSLARDGIRLTDFYANGTTCSPTRAGLISGRYQQRFGLEGPLPTDPAIAGERGLRATGFSLPQLLKNHGYATGLIGKWHLGYKPEHSPNAHGFDYFFGFRSGFHDYYTHDDGDGKPDLWENERQVARQGHTTDLVTDRAIAFIEQHAGEPFFIDIAYNAPHWPYQVPGKPSVAPDHARHVMPQDLTTSSRADYVAMVEHLDGGIGKVLTALERLGVADNTIVLFTNDNGGEWLSSSEPLTGRKWTVWEGGIRVPAIVRWPGHIPPGTVSDQVGMTMDLTASILAITGAPVPDEARLEGTNLFPVWEGQAPELERTLFWRSKQPNRLQRAVRRGDWKVVDDAGNTYVFNLRTDPSERHDLANRRQDIAQTLWPLMKAWEQDVDAEAAANQPAPSTAVGPAAATALLAAAATAPSAAPGPLVFDTWVPGPCSPNGQPQGQCPPGELFRVRLVPIAEGLRSPRHIAFTPDGDLLITELAAPAGDPAAGNEAVQGKPGQVRRIHDGVLAPAPLAGWPTPGIDAGALWSIVVHPQFAANHFVYLYYVKKGADGMLTRALARARLDGTSLLDVQELFVADAWIPGGPMAGRAVFGPDGMIYLTVNDHVEHDGKNGGGEPLLAQQLDNDVGKVLRIRDDGGIPADNPFVGRTDAKPEIFTYGQRNVTDFAWHPTTGELWSTEVAPMGGDEINVLHAGHNYGWPLVALGKNYNQKELNENHWYRPGMDMPAMYWTPSISPSTLVWYTGDKLAPWKGHLFVGALNGQTLVRVAFDQPMPQMERRDSLFMSLGRRWRHVVQGPDGYLYALTEKRTLGGEPDPSDATSGVVYRLEPSE